MRGDKKENWIDLLVVYDILEREKDCFIFVFLSR